MKKQIEETKIQKTKKCGILPFVTKFEVTEKIESLILDFVVSYNLNELYHNFPLGICRHIRKRVQELGSS